MDKREKAFTLYTNAGEANLSAVDEIKEIINVMTEDEKREFIDWLLFINQYPVD